MKFRFFKNAFIGILLFTGSIINFEISFSQEIYEIYVSENGNDTSTGTSAEPVRTIERGQMIALTVDKSKYDSIKIFLSGRFEMKSALVFTSSNSGAPTCPIIYESLAGQNAKITSGSKLKDKKIKLLDKEKLLYSINLDELNLNAKNLVSSQGIGMSLVIDEKKISWSSFPSGGWLEISNLRSNGNFFEISTEQLSENSGSDIWLGGYWRWDWAFSYHRAANLENNKFKISPPYHQYGYKEGGRFRLYNFKTKLEKETFYLDFENNRIVFSVSKQPQDVMLFTRKNKGFRLNGVRNLFFRGIIFEGNVSSDIVLNNCSDILVENCLFRNSLETPVFVKGGKNIRIKSCVFENLGGKGIEIDAGNRKLLEPSNHLVYNCVIRNFALVRKTYQPAIEIKGVGITLSHNLIEKAPHAGIIFKGNNHIIEYNELRYLATETSDVGVIYTGRDWSYRGNIIQNNFIHNSLCSVKGSVAAIYLDDFVSGTSIKNNIIHGVNIGILIGGGQFNEINNNTLFHCKKTSIHIDNRGATWAKEKAKPGGAWRMWRRLSEVNYKSNIYQEQYPDMKAFNTLNYQDPIGNKVIANKYITNFIDFEKKSFYPLVEIEGNKKMQSFNSEVQIQKEIREELSGYKVPPGIIRSKSLMYLLELSDSSVQ